MKRSRNKVVAILKNGVTQIINCDCLETAKNTFDKLTKSMIDGKSFFKNSDDKKGFVVNADEIAWLRLE
jgi:hypothetical protein